MISDTSECIMDRLSRLGTILCRYGNSPSEIGFRRFGSKPEFDSSLARSTPQPRCLNPQRRLLCAFPQCASYHRGIFPRWFWSHALREVSTKYKMQRGQTALTLIVNTEVATLIVIIQRRRETREGARFNPQVSDLSSKPAFAGGEAMFLDGVFGVQVVHANLPTRSSGLVTETWRHTHFSSLVPGNGSQRGEGNSAEGGCTLGPQTVQLHSLTDGATRQLVEKSK